MSSKHGHGHGNAVATSKGSGMSMGGSGVTGSAKKIVALVVALFAVMVFVPHIGPLFDLAGQLGGALLQIIGAVVNVLQMIGNALGAVGGQQ